MLACDRLVAVMMPVAYHEATRALVRMAAISAWVYSLTISSLMFITSTSITLTNCGLRTGTTECLLHYRYGRL